MGDRWQPHVSSETNTTAGAVIASYFTLWPHGGPEGHSTRKETQITASSDVQEAQGKPDLSPHC